MLQTANPLFTHFEENSGRLSFFLVAGGPLEVADPGSLNRLNPLSNATGLNVSQSKQ